MANVHVVDGSSLMHRIVAKPPAQAAVARSTPKQHRDNSPVTLSKKNWTIKSRTSLLVSAHASFYTEAGKSMFCFGD
jgi:hypothetical protein